MTIRTKNGKSISNLDQFNMWSARLRKDVRCHDVFLFKLQFGKTEEIIVRLLQYYMGFNNEIDIYWGAQYLGQNGCNQELDITIEKDKHILFGLSIKSGFGGYLEPNDLTIDYIKRNKNKISNFEPRGSVNGVLQDMARIRNIKEFSADNSFNSVPIIYDKPHQHNWINKMKTQFLDHDYLFLKDNSKLFYEELERINPKIITIKQI